MSRWKGDFLKLIRPEVESLYRLSFSDPDVPAWHKLALREQLQRLILHVLACYMQSLGQLRPPQLLAVHTLDCIFVLTGRSELAISWSEELKAAEVRDRLAGLVAADACEDVLIESVQRAARPYAGYDALHGTHTADDLRRVIVLFALSLALIEAADPQTSLHRRLALALLPGETIDAQLLQRRLASQPRVRPPEFIWMGDPGAEGSAARLYFIRKREGDAVEPGDEFGYAYSAAGMVPILCGLRGRIQTIYVHNGDVISSHHKLASVILSEEEQEVGPGWLR